MQIPMKNQTFRRRKGLRQSSSLFRVVGTCGQEAEKDPNRPAGQASERRLGRARGPFSLLHTCALEIEARASLSGSRILTWLDFV